MSNTLFQEEKDPSILNSPPSTVIEDDDDDSLIPQPSSLNLPLKDKDLPPIIREIVTNAPDSRKLPSFIASLAPLCALATRLRLHYYYDSRPSALLLHVLIEGAQSSGKSYAADIEDLIMAETLKARDKQQRRLEQEYREKKKRRKANEKLEEEPKTTIRVIPATISKTVLTKRADFYERILGDTLTFWMFAEELAQVTDAGKAAYSNLRTLMRTGWDLESLFGLDFASDNSYSAIVDINICCMFCTTPAALDDYMDKKAIEGGNITRCVLCSLEDSLGSDGALFKPYTPEQRAVIQRILELMMNDTYDADGNLQPTKELDMSWIDKTVKKWCRKKGHQASLTGSNALDVFRKRSSVSAFRIASLCYYLYLLEMGSTVPESQGSKSLNSQPSTLNPSSLNRIRKLCLRIYEYMAEYILNSLLTRWGKKYEDLNSKRAQDQLTTKKEDGLYFQLTDEFTRDQLKLICQQQNLTTAPRQFIYLWQKSGDIIAIDKNHFKKVKI